LLRAGGLRVALERVARPRVPAILLSDLALGLVRDVFERRELFARVPRINRRVVAWGEGAEPVTVPHSGVVVSETVMLDGLGIEAGDSEGRDFSVIAALPAPVAVEQKKFGLRRASAVPVVLKDEEDSSACWIESLDSGWLFLIPDGDDHAWLLAVGNAPLDESRLIAPRIDVLDGKASEFPACPRMIAPLCGSDWLACGTAAMAFDPICGDGTANAVREAILASAVIRGIAAGGDRPRLLTHYRRRLTAAMQKHLALCAEFYRTGGRSNWWGEELEAMRAGFVWCQGQLVEQPDVQYRLMGFELEAVR
jgi:hypothetical protein